MGAKTSGESQAFQQNVLEKLDMHSNRKSLVSHLLPYIKISSTCIQDLNVKLDIIKLLVENIGVNIHDLRLGDGFLSMTLKAQITKEK